MADTINTEEKLENLAFRIVLCMLQALKAVSLDDLLDLAADTFPDEREQFRLLYHRYLLGLHGQGVYGSAV
jgi:hypothetical protein